MKYLKIWAAVALLLATNTVSFLSYKAQKQENDKHYEAACHMSDLIRCYQDHLETDSLIEDYGCFEELYGVFLRDGDVWDNPINLSDYVWGY